MYITLQIPGSPNSNSSSRGRRVARSFSAAAPLAALRDFVVVAADDHGVRLAFEEDGGGGGDDADGDDADDADMKAAVGTPFDLLGGYPPKALVQRTATLQELGLSGKELIRVVPRG